MNHGLVSEGSSAEPNLTPLLDVVLQLLMFFMMCVNFVREQVSEEVLLPDSVSAMPMDKTENDFLFLNLMPFRAGDFRERGLRPEALAELQRKFNEGDPCVKVLVAGQDEYKSLRELRALLKQTYEDDERNTRDGKVRRAIIIRAHKDTDYEFVYDLLSTCKSVGFTNLKLRALSKVGTTS
jgi:biopolymer transport protein ExbD